MKTYKMTITFEAKDANEAEEFCALVDSDGVIDAELMTEVENVEVEGPVE